MDICKDKNANDIFKKYAHQTRQDSLRHSYVNNFSEQLLFYVAYNQSSLIELLARPLVSPADITRETKLWDIGSLTHGIDIYNTKEGYTNTFIPYIKEIALRLYKLNIDIEYIDCGFNNILQDKLGDQQQKDHQKLLYKQKYGKLRFNRLSTENNEILYDAICDFDSAPGMHDPYVRRMSRSGNINTKVQFPITMDTTLGEIVDILEEKFSNLQVQALCELYKYVGMVDHNNPEGYIYYERCRRNYDPYFNIIFHNQDQKERFYEGMKSTEGKKIAEFYLNKYKKDMDENSEMNLLINSHTDLLFINILCTIDENSIIGWGKIQNFIDYTKKIGIHTDYQRIRRKKGRFVINSIRPTEQDEANDIYERLDSYFNPLPQLNNLTDGEIYTDFEEI